MGFSTGEWVGNTLKVTTTHLKEGWLRRNGVARSDAATVTEHFIRHGNHLTWSVFVQDPKYLEEPFFRNRDYTLAENGLDRRVSVRERRRGGVARAGLLPALPARATTRS